MATEPVLPAVVEVTSRSAHYTLLRRVDAHAVSTLQAWTQGSGISSPGKCARVSARAPTRAASSHVSDASFAHT